MKPNMKKVSYEETTDILNIFWTRSINATGLRWLARQAGWTKAGEEAEPYIARFEYSNGEYEYIQGVSQTFDIAFGVGCDIRMQSGSGGKLFDEMTVSWGSGGRYEPQAKQLIHQKAIDTVTLFNVMWKEWQETHQPVPFSKIEPKIVSN